MAEFLEGASVNAVMFELRQDYRVLLIALEGLEPRLSDEKSRGPLAQAKAAARNAGTPEKLPHVAAWREAYRAFGAKPSRTRNSLEALLRRAPSGLPRVSRLTDVYNAISLLHQVPLRGEDLTRATGDEQFDTVAAGGSVLERPGPGEVVWCDDAGVTCRRWNWRQGQRTQQRDDTTAALFILDALAPMTDEDLHATADDLIAHLGPQVSSARRLIAAGGDR
jgi:DNA/RNA-binding domain of Phe-tRNA-synthetase-like protein